MIGRLRGLVVEVENGGTVTNTGTVDSTAPATAEKASQIRK